MKQPHLHIQSENVAPEGSANAKARPKKQEEQEDQYSQNPKPIQRAPPPCWFLLSFRQVLRLFRLGGRLRRASGKVHDLTVLIQAHLSLSAQIRHFGKIIQAG